MKGQLQKKKGREGISGGNLEMIEAERRKTTRESEGKEAEERGNKMCVCGGVKTDGGKGPWRKKEREARKR